VLFLFQYCKRFGVYDWQQGALTILIPNKWSVYLQSVAVDIRTPTATFNVLQVTNSWDQTSRSRPAVFFPGTCYFEIWCACVCVCAYLQKIYKLPRKSNTPLLKEKRGEFGCMGLSWGGDVVWKCTYSPSFSAKIVFWYIKTYQKRCKLSPSVHVTYL